MIATEFADAENVMARDARDLEVEVLPRVKRRMIRGMKRSGRMMRSVKIEGTVNRFNRYQRSSVS